MGKKHTHEWTGLWAQMGPFAPIQPSHAHQCFDRRCTHLLIGAGKDCKPKVEHHIAPHPESETE